MKMIQPPPQIQFIEKMYKLVAVCNKQIKQEQVQ